MKHRVLLNTKQKRLIITTSDIKNEDIVELCSAQVDINHPNAVLISLGMCKMYCLGYIQGNNNPKVINDVKEFE
jgi:hypothetical protein